MNIFIDQSYGVFGGCDVCSFLLIMVLGHQEHEADSDTQKEQSKGINMVFRKVALRQRTLDVVQWKNYEKL